MSLIVYQYIFFQFKAHHSKNLCTYTCIVFKILHVYI